MKIYLSIIPVFVITVSEIKEIYIRVTLNSVMSRITFISQR